MKVEIDIPDSFLIYVLNTNGYHLSGLTKEQLEEIKTRIAETTVSNWQDEPHYFFDDYISKTLPYKEEM